MHRLALLHLSILLLPALVLGDDWPQYRKDAGRTGYTAESLPVGLRLVWTHEARQPPTPAWPRSRRMTFDHAYQPVVAAGRLHFGSSADCKVYALEAATGEELWSFFTGGPVRFAPAVSDGRLFVGSDDGYLYCLSAASGELLWKRRGGPDDRKVLGNERMVSLWPVRGGPVVLDSTVYFAAGIWPSEGLYIRAVDPSNGAPLWVNDSSGTIYMAQPHGGANAKSGPAAQGYLAATSGQLFVPTGRAVPAAFDRGIGKFQYFHLQKYGQRGGADVMASGRGIFNGGLSYLASSGELLGRLSGSALAASPAGIISCSAKKLTAHRLREKETKNRKGQVVRKLAPASVWSHRRAQGTPAALIVAGDTAIIGQENSVLTHDLKSGKELASLEVDGTVHGLAVAGGRLFASTDRGKIFCFAAGGSTPEETPKSDRPPATTSASPDGVSEVAARAAEAILRQTGIREGYCLDLGCGDGQLALEIARRSRLKIYAVDPDAGQVAAARRKLDAAGFHGTRVTVHRAALDATGYPQHFANLIVSGRSIQEGTAMLPDGELTRLLRPYGGVACTGRPDELQMVRRGALPGAGSWTHQYADPANTACSGDVRVRGKLETLWYRDVDQPVPQRHGRGPAPLFSQGRLLCEGLDSVVAVDAYNGHVLWRFPLKGILRAYDGDHLMGTAGTGSNYCVAGGSVYVRREDHCIRIDLATGKQLGLFKAPPRADGAPGIWGFIACEDGVLYGSLADPDHVVTYRYQPGGDLSHQLTESGSIFAMDALTGDLKWHYVASHSIRHNAIAIGGDRVYVIDRPAAIFDRRRKPAKTDHPAGELIAIDAQTGEEVWKSGDDIHGTMLALSVPHKALLMCYQNTRFKLASEVGGRLTVLGTDDGKRFWEKKKGVRYGTRPVINDRTIYAEGGAWDLLTGEDRPFYLKRSYGCGQMASGASMLLYRSATLGYFDLEENIENRDFGGIRPGCWINAIPAGGMVLVPDASAGCACSYLNQAWIALRPVPQGGAGR